MSSELAETQYDIIVIGSGPAGQKAAVQAAKAGKHVAMVEIDKVLGGACVHHGTIPRKTLRENALRIANLRNHAELFFLFAALRYGDGHANRKHAPCYQRPRRLYRQTNYPQCDCSPAR